MIDQKYFINLDWPKKWLFHRGAKCLWWLETANDELSYHTFMIQILFLCSCTKVKKELNFEKFSILKLFHGQSVKTSLNSESNTEVDPFPVKNPLSGFW